MWTIIDTNNMPLTKPYKLMLGTCRTRIKELKESDWIIDTGIEEVGRINVVPLICYAATKCMDDRAGKEAVKHMSLYMMKVLAGMDEESKERERRHRQLDNRERESGINCDYSYLESLGENRQFRNFAYIVYKLLFEGEELGANILAEVLTISFMTVNLPYHGSLLANPLHQVCAIIYWWGNKHEFYDCYFNYYRTSTKLKRYKTRKPASNQSMYDFVFQLYYLKSGKNLFRDFLVSGETPTLFFYKNMDRYIKANKDIVQKEDKFNTRSSTINGICNDLKNKDLDLYGFDYRLFFDMRKVNTYAYYIMSAYNSIPWYSTSYEIDLLFYYLWHEVSEKPGKHVLPKSKVDIFEPLIRIYSRMKISVSYEDFVTLFYDGMPSIIKRLESSEEKAESLDSKSKSLRSLADDIKQKYKAAEKQRKELESEIASLKSNIQKLEGKVASEMSKEEVTELQRKYRDAQEMVDSTSKVLFDTERSLGKAQREVEKLRKAVDDAETETLKALEEKDRLQELNSELSKYRKFKGIPIECFVNALKKYNILLIGGDMIHEKLRAYGLDNITYAKAGCRNLRRDDIISRDLIVVATIYIDHSTTASLSTQVKMNPDIKLLKYNNSNHDGLIYEMFQALYK